MFVTDRSQELDFPQESSFRFNDQTPIFCQIKYSIWILKKRSLRDPVKYGSVILLIDLWTVIDHDTRLCPMRKSVDFR